MRFSIKNPEATLAWTVWLLFWALMLWSFSGCSTVAEKYPRHELVDQILKPRRGHEGKLTNRACEEWDLKTGECLKYVVKEYAFGDATFRKTANSLGIVCNIAGRRYKLCEEKEGFCRFQRKKCGFLNLKTCLREVGFIPSEPYSFLLDADTTCFNDDRYPFSGEAE